MCRKVIQTFIHNFNKDLITGFCRDSLLKSGMEAIDDLCFYCCHTGYRTLRITPVAMKGCVD